MTDSKSPVQPPIVPNPDVDRGRFDAAYRRTLSIVVIVAVLVATLILGVAALTDSSEAGVFVGAVCLAVFIVVFTRYIRRSLTDFVQLLSERSVDASQLNLILEQEVAERSLSEAALRESEERYRRLFDDVPVGIYRSLPDGQITAANQAMVAMFGYPDRDSLLATNALDLWVDPSLRREWKASLDRDEVLPAFQVLAKQHDGSTVWLENSTRAFRDTDGHVVYYEGALKEIGERIEVEKAQQYHSDFQAIISSLATGFINVRTDQIDDAIIQALGAVGEFVGAMRVQVSQYAQDAPTFRATHEWHLSHLESIAEKAGDVQRKPLAWALDQLQHGVLVVPDTDDLPLEAAAMKALLQAFEVKAMIAVPLVRETGVFGFVSIHLAEARPLRPEDTAGLLQIIAEVLVNALDRQHTEQALRKSEERFRGLFDGMPVGMYRSTPDGEFLEVNPAMVAMLGYPDRETLLAVNAVDLYVDPDQRRIVHDVLAEQGIITAYPLQLRRYDGRSIWIESSTRVIQDRARQAIYYEGALQDVTEQRLAEAAQRESEERYRTLFEGAPIGISLSVLGGEVLMLNDAMKQLLGYSREELGQLGGVAGYHNLEDRAQMVKRLEKDGFVKDYELDFLTKEGEIRHTSFTIVPFPMAGKDFVLTMVLDISERKQAEEALRESEERYRAVSEIVSDYAFANRVNEDGTFESEWMTEDAFYRITGYRHRDVVEALHKDQFTHPDDLDRLRADHEKVAAGEPSSGEYRVRMKSGEWRWLRVDRRPIWDEAQGRVVRYLGAARDITEQKEAEEALRASEERYRTISETVSDYAFANRVNPDGTLENEWVTDESFYRITGYHHDEVWPALRQVYHPEDLARLRADLARVTAGEATYGAYRIITKSGEVRWVRIDQRPVWDEEQQRVTRFHGAARDITAEKRGEEALRESEERYRAVSETVSDYAFANRVNPDGTMENEWITDDSFYRVTGYHHDEVWQTIREIYHPDDRARIGCDVARVIAGEETSGEYRLITKGGDVRWVRIDQRPVWDATQERVIRFHGGARDITAEKQAEEALRESEERYRAISETVSDYAYSNRVTPEGIYESEWITEDAFQRVTGYQYELIKDQIEKLYPPEDWKRLIAGLDQLIAGEVVSGEYRIITKSGTWRWLQINRRPVWDEEQERVIRYHGAARDITERKEAEEALRESEERYRVISETVSDYAFSMGVAPDGSLETEWVTNEAFHRITGYYNEEIHDKNIVFPEDQERQKQDHAKTLAGEAIGGEYRIITKSGDVRWLQINRHPVWDDEQQRVIRFYGAAKDVTERKRAEEALQQTTNRLRTLHEIDQAILRADTPEATAQAALTRLREMVPCTRASVVVFDLEAGLGTLLAVHANGDIHHPRGFSMPLGDIYPDIDNLQSMVSYTAANLDASADMPTFIQTLQKEGLRAFTRIPLVCAGEVIGALNLGNATEEAFAPDHLEIAQEVADQMAIIIQQMTLFEDNRRRAEELDALRQMTLNITAQLDLERLLETLVEQALAILGAKNGGIYLVRPDREVLESVVMVLDGVQSSETIELKRGEGLSGKVWDCRKSMIIQDYANWEDRAQIFDSIPFGSVVSAPIFWGNQVLGVIDAGVARPTRKRLTERDARLLELIAHQAAIAIHNAQLFEDNRRRAEELDALRHMTLNITAELDLQKLLGTLVDQALTILGGEHGGLYLYQPDQNVIESVVTVIDNKRDPMRTQLKFGEGLCGTVWERGESIFVDDYAVWDGRAEAFDQIPVGSVIGAPIRWGDEFLGVINASVSRRSQKRLTESDARLLELIGHQAAIAIHNAQLFEDNRRRAEELDALRQMTLEITAQLDLDSLLQAIARNAIQLLGAYGGGIYLYRPEREVLESVVTLDDRRESPSGVELQKGEGLAGKVWERGESIVVGDYSSWEGRAQVYDHFQVSSSLGAPIQRGQEFLGVIAMTHHSDTRRTFSDHDARLLELIAHQAAIAIHKVQLFAASQRRAEELDTLRQVTLGITAELGLETLLTRITEAAVALLDGHGGGISLYRPDRNILEWVLSINLDDIPIGSELQRGEGTAGQVWERGETVFIDDYSTWEHHSPAYENMNFSAVIGAPIQWRDEFLGTIGITHQGATGRTFSEHDAQLLEMFAHQAAVAIYNARLYEQIQRHAAELEERVAERTADLQAANERLQVLSRAKDDFVANISHELRTPLTSMRINLHMLNRRPEKSPAYLTRLERETDRLENMIESLLLLSRMDQERVIFDFAPLDLNGLIGDYVADRAPMALDDGLMLSLDPTPDLPSIRADKDLVGQIVSIFLTNALTYTPSGGTVVVHTDIQTDETGQWAGFSVADTGPGIVAEDQAELFTRFFRGQAARKTGITGTGLGLAIAKEIVDRHQGRIEVESTGVPGQGSTFRVWFPI